MQKRWLNTKRTFWDGREWNPASTLDKDRVYVGNKAPPAEFFRPLGQGEAAPSSNAYEAKPMALSQLQNPGTMAPVVDGQTVQAEAPALPPSPVTEGAGSMFQ